MKAIVFLLLLALSGCKGKPKEHPVGTGIRVKMGPDGKTITVPDSSRRDSL